MDAQYSVERRHAFIAGAEELKKLVNVLTDRVGTVKIRVDCADDIARDFSSVRDLLAYENPKSKQVRCVSLSAQSDDYSKRATIRMSGKRWGGISIDLVAREDVLTRLQTEILDIIAGMRPWYGIVHRVDFVAIAFCALALIWFSVVAIVAFGLANAPQPKQVDPTSSARTEIIGYGAIAVLLAFGFTLNRFRDSIFPLAVFKIGQGTARFKHLEQIQWSVVVGFFVSLAAGLVVLVWQSSAG
jgi:hypothetical protein